MMAPERTHEPQFSTSRAQAAASPRLPKVLESGACPNRRTCARQRSPRFTSVTTWCIPWCRLGAGDFDCRRIRTVSRLHRNCTIEPSTQQLSEHPRTEIQVAQGVSDRPRIFYSAHVAWEASEGLVGNGRTVLERKRVRLALGKEPAAARTGGIRGARGPDREMILMDRASRVHCA